MRSVLNTKSTLAGAVLAGIGASACCVGPLLLLSMGIGGAWIVHLTALEPYRPVFLSPYKRHWRKRLESSKQR